ncbi:MAG: hypothetical protein ACRDHM_07335 [Actinomycetota bacterium]
MPHTDAGPIPDAIEPLVGIRGWTVRISGDEVLFHPVSGSTGGWEGAGSGWVEATCLFAPWIPHAHLSLVTDEPSRPTRHCDLCDQGHVAPEESCTCGFYAFKELSPELVAVLTMAPDPGSAQDLHLVVGRVELAGKVIEHDLGYRAGRARIAALIPVEGRDPFTREVSRLTGIPLDPPIRLRRPLRKPASWRTPIEDVTFGWVWMTCWLAIRMLAMDGGLRVAGLLLLGTVLGTVVLGRILVPRLRDKIRALLWRRRGGLVRLKVVR